MQNSRGPRYGEGPGEPLWRLFLNVLYLINGGERGSRTPGKITPTPVFKTGAIDHSAISPHFVETLLFNRLEKLSILTRVSLAGFRFIINFLVDRGFFDLMRS
jgi:hypothetical protein